jgi:hypothetical protein
MIGSKPSETAHAKSGSNPKLIATANSGGQGRDIDRHIALASSGNAIKNKTLATTQARSVLLAANGSNNSAPPIPITKTANSAIRNQR